MADKCGKTTDLLSAYLDGELTGAEAERCSEHLEQCADCRRVLAALSAARSLLREMPQPEPPGWLPGAIKVAAAESRAAALPVWRTWVAPVAAAAALVIALSVGLLNAPDTSAPDASLAAAPAQTHVADPITSLIPEDSAVAAARDAILSATEAPTDEAADEAAEVLAALPRPVIRRRTVAVAPVPEPVAPVAATDPSPEQPVFAYGAALPDSGPVAAEIAHASAMPVDEVLVVALAPRLTPVADAIGEIPAPAETAEPSLLDRELASGVLASMLVEEFIEEHLIETTPTLLSVVTATPSAELGPRIVEGEDDPHFELCFTEAMRRALGDAGE